MALLDLRKEYKHLYSSSAKTVRTIDVPELGFLTVDGVIDPGRLPGDDPIFAEAIGALYGVAYTLKFTSKLRTEDPVDYPVMPLEGLWSAGGGFDPRAAAEAGCTWTLMIMMPDLVTGEMVEQAAGQVRKKHENRLLDQVRLERFREGLALQTLHVGPYADEPRTLALMAKYAEENGLEYQGKHHEIYLGDPRRAKPEKLKTLLRQPVAPSGAALLSGSAAAHAAASAGAHSAGRVAGD